MKKVLLAFAALVVVLIVALFVVPPMMGGFVKERVATAVEDATGREVTIDRLDFALLPSITVELAGLRLGNAEGMPSPEMVSIGSLELELGLFPLLGKSVEIDRLVVSELAVFLEKDANGRANWVFPQAQQDGAKHEGGQAHDGKGEFPLSNLILTDLRLEKTQISYLDLATGQTIQVGDLGLAATLPGLSRPLDLAGGFVLNDKRVGLQLGISSPRALVEEGETQIDARIEAELLQAGVNLAFSQAPALLADGTASLEIGSVGDLLLWLDQPLPEGQPDPGPLKIAATFATEGERVVLQEALIAGDGLDAKAQGSIDTSGDVLRLAFEVESGLLDIDRYLPPRQQQAEAPTDQPMARDHDGPRDDPMKGLSDEPFDLSGLQGTEADIRVSVGGVRAMGYEVGQIGFTARLTGGALQADLERLELYGGAVTGSLALDGSGEELGVDSNLVIDNVDLGKLSAVSAAGDAPVAGVASGNLTLAASGGSPRALVQGLQAALDFKLGDLDVKNAAGATLTGLDAAVTIPGLSQPPSVSAAAVYNRRKVTLDVGLDPLDRVLSGDPFALKVAANADLMTFGFDGTVQQHPLPGANGTLAFASPSVGKLLSWLGQPLPKGQPDPGPLEISAELAAEGERVELTKATIKGDGMEATASGLVEMAEDRKRVALDISGGFLDIDRYLPPPAPKPEQADVAATTPAGPGGDPLAALSDEPIDLSALKALEADIKVALEGVRVAGFEMAPIEMTGDAADGALTLEVTRLGLYGGNATGRVRMAESGGDLDAEVAVQVASLDLAPLMTAAGMSPAPVTGIAGLDVTAKATGRSPRALAESLSAKVAAALDQGSLAALDGGSIDGLRAEVDLPGMANATTAKVAMRLNGEALDLNLAVDTPEQAMNGEAFGLDLSLASAPATASVKGTVQQQPVPGLDGALSADIPSLGGLLAWIGQPLPEGQPDPGPIKLAGSLATDGGKVTLKSLDIEGKAAKATANGFVDPTGNVILFGGDLQIANLDLNAYLPPPAKKKAPAEDAAPADAGPKDWSTEPINFSHLHRAQGKVNVTTGPVTYRKVNVMESAAEVVLDGGVMTATVGKLIFDQGSAEANARVDAAGKTPKITYQVELSDIESKPFLETFADMDRLSGRLAFSTSGSTAGANEKELVSNLNGDGAFMFADGAYEGFDLAGTLRNVGSLGIASGGERPKTDFTEMGGSFTIVNGLLNNQDFKMLAPLVRVGGAGDVNLPPRTLDYQVNARLVPSTTGQGGEEAIAGLPIPIRAKGSWDNPKIEIDWTSVLQAAALDPERLSAMPDNMKGLAEGLGVAIPGLGGGSSGESGGAGGVEGAVGSVLNQLLGGGDGGSSTAPAESGTEAAPSEAEPEPATEQKKKKSLDPGSLLKKLF
jgi:AsmA protein